MSDLIKKYPKIVEYIKKEYDEDKVLSLIDEAMLNYIDFDWEEDGEYKSEYEWYCDFGHREAEDEIHQQIFDYVRKNFDESYIKTYSQDDDDLVELINEIFPKLKG